MDPLFAARVNGQGGVVSRAQALAAGLSGKTIECHLATGRWLRLHPGVYLTRPGRDDWEMRAVAALLHAGPGAALSHLSAAHVWSLVRQAPHPIEVVVPASRRVVAVDGVQVRRSRHASARIDPHGWPHRTTAEDTVLDLALGRPLDQAIALAAKAIDLRITSMDRLARALEQRPRQGHRSLLLEVLHDVESGAESPAEVRYVRDVERAHGLPPGRSQTPMAGGRRRDREYEEWGVVVEIDGRLGHDGWGAVQRDGQRDRAATVGGRTTLRCYWVDLVPAGCALAVDVATVLRAKGWSGTPHGCRRGCPVGPR
ncbi:MAG TPA: type IV toxin-antitoxin system AbiEi family antitoxin domain-containing protein [Intrasporangium sp.]|uniref:type IV toxin-antitoxin system AbiEi family antitoxin domain-containing protein n=1 Tax=Intrasporangium sp. TaxID=1925024 RepID=UPI002D77B9F2|nr:type IV toxin-antitoxin system AbiEi family antitoxin domain-containing protein [Intrasporangium sp.]HET7398949.1 type IV toxin-antitoxin system AbiEi family antitoxin domain-containing protein [Intrasporangium sp.]